MAEGSINQLNFEVILKDANFEARLKALQAIAEAFNTSMSNALAISKVTEGTRQVNELDKSLKKAAEGAKNLNTQLKAMPVERVTKLANETKNASSQMSNMRSVLGVISQLTGAAFSVIGLRRFLSTLVDVTGQFEVQKMALRNMLQDVEAADRIFQDLYEFSSRSTYRFSELAKYSKQLAAFNISKDSLLETTKMLGDVASGVGVSMDRLILAYGHVKSSGFLRGIQLRSFSQNGVPILEELSKMFTEIEGKAVSLGDVFDKMMKREIPFEMVEEAFKRMTSEGGKFYRMQEVLAKTLAGQINILKGKWENMMYAIGQSEEGFLKGTVQSLTKIVDHMDQIANALKPVIIGLGAYGAALLAVAAAQKAVDLARFAKYFVLLAQRTNIATAAVKVFGSATKAAAVGIGLAVTAIAAMVMAVRNTTTEVAKFKKHLDDIHNTVRDNDAYDAEISQIETLRKLLNDTNQSYDTRKVALDKLKAIVPQYHADLTEEGRLINNNTTALDAYIEALNREAKMKGAQDELTELYKERREVLKEIQERQKDVDAYNSSPAPGYIVPAGKTALESALAPTKLQNANEKLKVLDDTIAGINKEIAETIGSGQTAADGMVYNVSSIVEGLQNIDTELDKLRKKAKTKGITVVEKEQLDALKAQREEQTKLYKDIMGVDYDKSVRAGETQQNKLIKDRISGLKAEIQLLQKYKQTYEAFESILGPEGAREMTGKVYKEANITNFDFTSQIVELTNALRALGDEAGAESVLAAIGLGEGREIQKNLQQAQQTAQTYKELIRSMTTEDTSIEGKGFWYDISKVASDLETKLNKLILQGQKAKERLAGIDINNEDQKKAIFHSLRADGWSESEIQEFWNKWIAGGRKAIDDFIADSAEKAKAAAKERATDLAKGYVEEQFFLEGIDFNHLSDKTLGQLKSLKQKLYDVLKKTEIKQTDRDMLALYGIDVDHLEDVNLDEVFDTLAKERLVVFDEATQKTLRLMQAVQKTKASFEDFSDAVGKIVKGRLKDLTEEEKKALLSFGQFAVDCVSQVINALEKLGEATSSRQLSDLAQGFNEAAKAIKSVMEGFKQGGPLGAVIAGVASLATWAIEGATAIAELDGAIVQARMDMERLNFEMSLSEGVSSIFGDNEIRKIQNATKGIEEATKAMDELQKRSKKEFKVYNNWFERVFNEYTGFSLQELADEVGGKLYDEKGNYNAKTLQTILDTYKGLATADKEWLQEAIINAENYQDAIDQLDSAMESLFGDIATKAADTIVDGWIEAGKAALDYADILDDVAQSYAKMVIKSMILDEEEGILNSAAVKQLSKAFVEGDAAQAMTLLEGKLQELADLEPVFQQVLETFDPYFKREESERTASTKALSTSFSQDTIDYWSGQLTLLVEYARRGDEQRETISSLVLALRDSMAAGGNGDYTSNVQTYLATIQSDTSAMRSDIYSMRLAIQNMNDKGVKML